MVDGGSLASLARGTSQAFVTTDDGAEGDDEDVRQPVEFASLHAGILDLVKQAQHALRGFDVHVAAPFNNGFRCPRGLTEACRFLLSTTDAPKTQTAPPGNGNLQQLVPQNPINTNIR